MSSRGNIASAAPGNNRVAVGWPGLAFLASGALLLAGCAATAVSTAAAMPTWELANAESVTPVPIARVRVSYDRPLPATLTQKLCDEFSLVTINTPDDWAEVRRRLQLADPVYPVSFAGGTIVGVLASVGEAAQAEWPIHIVGIRTRGGLGWLEAGFNPGVYYPVKTAAYLELAYVPGLRAVCMARVGHRTFVIRTPMPVY